MFYGMLYFFRQDERIKMGVNIENVTSIFVLLQKLISNDQKLVAASKSYGNKNKIKQSASALCNLPFGNSIKK